MDELLREIRSKRIEAFGDFLTGMEKELSKLAKIDTRKDFFRAMRKLIPKAKNPSSDDFLVLRGYTYALIHLIGELQRQIEMTKGSTHMFAPETIGKQERGLEALGNELVSIHGILQAMKTAVEHHDLNQYKRLLPGLEASFATVEAHLKPKIIELSAISPKVRDLAKSEEEAIVKREGQRKGGILPSSFRRGAVMIALAASIFSGCAGSFKEVQLAPTAAAMAHTEPSWVQQARRLIHPSSSAKYNGALTLPDGSVVGYALNYNENTGALEEAKNLAWGRAQVAAATTGRAYGPSDTFYIPDPRNSREGWFVILRTTGDLSTKEKAKVEARAASYSSSQEGQTTDWTVGDERAWQAADGVWYAVGIRTGVGNPSLARKSAEERARVVLAAQGKKSGFSASIVKGAQVVEVLPLANGARVLISLKPGLFAKR